MVKKSNTIKKRFCSKVTFADFIREGLSTIFLFCKISYGVKVMFEL